MPTLKELEQWLSTSQVARELGRSRQGAMWMAEHKRVRAVKTANGWLYDPKSVEEVKAGEKQTESGPHPAKLDI